MSKFKKLLMFTFCALLLDDGCKYIKAVFLHRFGSYKHFSFLYTSFEQGNVYNLGLIFFILVAVVYFATHFFEPDSN